MLNNNRSSQIRYRTYQFFAAVRAHRRVGLSEADRAFVQPILPTPPQRLLFEQMLPNDQRHAIAVARLLEQAGHTEMALLQAALLHDVGKLLGQPILYRVLIVLLELSSEPLLQRVSAASPLTYADINQTRDHLSRIPRWRQPFVIHAQHPIIGAAWAEAVGCEPSAVRLIARHQDTISPPYNNEEDRLLHLLQWADNLN